MNHKNKGGCESHPLHLELKSKLAELLIIMPIAKEGLREILLSALFLGLVGTGVGWLWWPLSIPFFVIWIWVLSFFRDPRRVRTYAPGDFCSPADGTITEIKELEHHDAIGGPAIRVGMFLSLFNVHVNRMPCSGRVKALDYKQGEFLDARHPDSGERNESNTLVIEPDAPLVGPIVVRQVAGLVARRIICHARNGQHWAIGSRFGLIKFGSRTELIVPKQPSTQVLVSLGEKVRGGLTILVRQDVASANVSKATLSAAN